MYATVSRYAHDRRHLLIALDLFMAFWCEMGMLYALGGADGVPRSWLEGTPFGNYVVPGLILGVVVGGLLFAAAWLLRRRVANADAVTAIAGLVLIAWILEETMLIGLVSALQPIVLAYGIALFWLAVTSVRASTDRMG